MKQCDKWYAIAMGTSESAKIRATVLVDSASPAARAIQSLSHGEAG